MRVTGREGSEDGSDDEDADDAVTGEKPCNMRKSACISCSSPSDSTSTHCISVKTRINSAPMHVRAHTCCCRVDGAACKSGAAIATSGSSSRRPQSLSSWLRD
jgi:hypothetical protein